MVDQKLPPVSSPAPAVQAPVAKAPPSKPGLPRPSVAAKRRFDVASLPFWMGLLLSLAWACGVFLIVARSGPTHTFGGVPLTDWAIGISAIVSPVALVWMVAAYVQRAADLQSVAEPLRRQLSLITGESGAAEARIRRFNQAIREQIELLRGAQGMTKNDLVAVMERVRGHKNEMERLEQTSIHQVKDIQDIIRRNMQQVEQMMDDKFTMMRVLDDKLMQNGDSVAKHIETVRYHVANLLEEIEGNSRHLSETLTRAMQDSKKLSDTSRAQENSLITAAESAAETLGTVSSKIDLSVARFMERAGVAREEAERLAGALDVQTHALDEFSNILPARVGEAESVLRGVADRLYASEQLASEQAVNLSEKLASQIDSLENFMGRFTDRLSHIDGGLQQRHNDLESLGRRIGDTTENFAQVWEDSVGSLGDRANSMLARFSSVSDETRERADQAAAYLAETVEKYESSSNRMRTVSDESAKNVKALTAEISTHLEQFEALRASSQTAGEEIQGRATSAMQNFQHVLERLLAARDVVQSIGGTLVKDLHGAVDQNEHLIGRLNEAAQMSVRALGIAAESLGRQENALTLQARAAQNTFQESIGQLQNYALTAEKGLREQANGLVTLLGETQAQMNLTDEKLQTFTTRAISPIQEAIRQIDTSADQGLLSITNYGDGLQEQLGRLQQFNGRISGIGEELGRVTVETANSIENLSNRFAAARVTQEETVRHALGQFNEMADRLQREVVGLDGTTTQAVTTLQQAAARVGEQSYQLLQNAENSGSKMQLVTTALQTEATQIRAMLQKQADDLGADLNRAEKQFSTLGEALRQRTDAAYALLDRVAVHYNETTRTAAQDLEARTHRIEQVAGETQGKVETLNASLLAQMELLDSGSSRFETHATDVSALAGKTLQQLSAVNEKFAVTHEAANSNIQATIARLDECSTVFVRQTNSLSEVAQTSTAMVQKASSTFGEQAGKLLDTSQHMDQSLRQLTSTTSVLADQSAQIRSVMEQQNQRLIAQLTESVSQLETTGSKLERSVSAAMIGTEQVSSRITEVTHTASQRLGSSHQEMQNITSKTEATLAALGANITQQAASLSVISEQLSDQYNTLGAASEGQKTQLVELFDKLGSAHGQASEVAERTITRLSESLQQIQRQLGALSDQSQTAIGNVRAASAGFGDQAGVLIQNAQQAEQQARTVLSVTAALQDQARVLRESLHGESERTHEILGSLLGRISAGGVELRDLGSSAELVLNSLQVGVTQQASSLNNSMQQIADRQRTLTVALDAQRDVINGLLSRLTLAQDETASTAERAAARLTEGTQQLARQIEVIDTQTQSTLSGVQAASVRFTDEAVSLGNHAQQAEQQLRGVLSATAGMQEQAKQLRESLHADSERTQEILGGLLSRISAGGVELRDVGSSTELVLNSLQNGVTQQVSSLNGAMQQITERQRALVGALDAQRGVVDGLLNRLVLAQDETASTAERTTARLTDGAQHLERRIEAIDTQTQSALTRVQAASAQFADEAGTLGMHAQQAEQQMRGVLSVTATLQEQAQKLREAMQGDSKHTHEVLDGLLGRLSAGGVELRGLGSSAEEVLGNLQSGLTQQVVSLNGAMQQIMERQHSLAGALESQRSVIDGLLNRLALAQDETASMAERTAARLTDGAQQIEAKIEAIDTQAQNALTRVQAASAQFNDTAGSLGTHAQEAEQQMRSILSVATTLQEQSRTMQSESEQTHETLGNLLSRLLAGGVELRDLGSSTEGVLGNIQNGLTQQVSSLSGAMQQITERQQTLTVALDSQRNVISSLLDRLATAQSDAASTAERTAAHMTDGAQQIERKIEALDMQTQSALTRVQAASAQFADEAGTLGMHAQQAEQQMRGVLSVTATLHEQAQTLREEMQGDSKNAREALDGLLQRLSVGGTELRGLGSSAEEVLENLQNGLTQHANSLNGTMQQITERQNVLTVGLESQRKVIDDLLSRLTLAQDETASAAERAASRLTDGTQQLTRQIEVIDTQAQSTLANVRVAGAQFADEAGALGVHAQQAEQQMRGVLSVTAGMQEQARQLREAMQGESARVIERLNAVISQLDATSGQLKIQSDTAINAVDQSALQFGTMARSSVEAMSLQAELLSHTARESETRMATAEERLRTNTKLIGDVGEQSERQARQLADTAEYASSRIVTLREALALSDKDGRETLIQASNRIDEIKTHLQDEMQRLADLSQDAVQKVAAASQQLTVHSDVLRSNLAVSESALTNAVHLVRDESSQIPAIIDRSTAKLEDAALIMKNQAGEAEKTLIGTADRFIGVTTTARESMVDEMRRVSAVADEAGRVLSAFNATLSEQVLAMRDGTSTFTGEQNVLIEKAGESVAQLASAGDRLAELRRDATQTAEKLAKEFEVLDQRATDTSQRFSHMGDTVNKQVEAISETTQRAEGQMLDATRSFREQFERVRSSMQGQIDDINRGLMQITAQLERTGNTLRSTTAGTVADVERISQRFDQTSKEAANQLVDKTTRMRGATEEVAKLLSGFGDQLDVLLNRLSVAGDGIKRHEGDLIAQLETALAHLATLASGLENGRTLATNVSQQAVQRLNDVVETIQQQAHTLAAGSQTAAGIMRGVGQIYNDQTQALTRGVGEAHTQVQEMNKSIDDMQQRADRMRVSLKMQSDELMSSLQQILHQLNSTGDALGDAVDQALEEKAAAALKKIG